MRTDDYGVTGSATPSDKPRVAGEEPTEPARKPVSVLAIGTEWSSGHGGLSTFNRQLCIALAQAGVNVTCLVLEATETEKREAAAQGVMVVEAERAAGLDDQQRLMRKPRGIADLQPDFIIGHGRITGPAAEALATDHYPSARRLHFVHMAPDEIEFVQARPDRRRKPPGPGPH